MDIDIVIPWVDGNDPAWQEEKRKYQTGGTDDSNSVNRFRDWGLLPYWFRGIETFAPWVRKIHFVTWGHLPDFLNIDNPKLHIVRHEEYIPQKYLPTFSSHTIEMNFFRIPDLAEHFIYFNDDMFLVKNMLPEHFFKNGKPCTCGMEEPFCAMGEDGLWRHIIVNNMRIINNHFDKREQVCKNPTLYRNKVYGWKTNVRTSILQVLFPYIFLGFRNLHAPAAYCKSTFEIVWKEEQEVLDHTCSHRFRSLDDVNQWIMLWWQVASGNASPRMVDNRVEDVTEQNIVELCKVIKKQEHEMICLNDPSGDIDFEILALKLKEAFEVILPVKSSFEK